MAFSQKQSGQLVYMVSDVIRFPHAFCTRYGGVSRGIYESLNIGSNRGDDPACVRENYTRLCALMGAGPNECGITNQVHGKEVRVLTRADAHECMGPTPYEADGIVTAEPDFPIMCFTADCVPGLLCDAEQGIAAAVHCGWRSSVADIIGETVRKMKQLGAREENICAAFGPAIGFCCFETDDDVPDAIEKWLDGDTEGLFRRRPDGKTMVDLRGANARRLRQLGIAAEHIDCSDECTVCSHDKYWSHRYTKGQRGTQASIIKII